MKSIELDEVIKPILVMIEENYRPDEFGLPEEIAGADAWRIITANFALGFVDAYNKGIKKSGADAPPSMSTEDAVALAEDAFFLYMSGSTRRMSLVVPAYIPDLLLSIADSERSMGKKVSELIISACLPPQPAGILEKIEAHLSRLNR